ncbi:MAG: hypothetical protein Alpg2KO_03870 [Alphaproteobacteria bacterium]
MSVPPAEQHEPEIASATIETQPDSPDQDSVAEVADPSAEPDSPEQTADPTIEPDAERSTSVEADDAVLEDVPTSDDQSPQTEPDSEPAPQAALPSLADIIARREANALPKPSVERAQDNPTQTSAPPEVIEWDMPELAVDVDDEPPSTLIPDESDAVSILAEDHELPTDEAEKDPEAQSIAPQKKLEEDQPVKETDEGWEVAEATSTDSDRASPTDSKASTEDDAIFESSDNGDRTKSSENIDLQPDTPAPEPQLSEAAPAPDATSATINTNLQDELIPLQDSAPEQTPEAEAELGNSEHITPVDGDGNAETSSHTASADEIDSADSTELNVPETPPLSQDRDTEAAPKSLDQDETASQPSQSVAEDRNAEAEAAQDDGKQSSPETLEQPPQESTTTETALLPPLPEAQGSNDPAANDHDVEQTQSADENADPLTDELQDRASPKSQEPSEQEPTDHVLTDDRTDLVDARVEPDDAEPVLQNTDEQPLSPQDSAPDEDAGQLTTDQHHAKAVETEHTDADPEAEEIDDATSLSPQSSSEQEHTDQVLTGNSADSADDRTETDDAEPALQSADEEPLSLQDSVPDEGDKPPITDQHHAQAVEISGVDADPETDEVDDTASLSPQDSGEQQHTGQVLTGDSTGSVDGRTEADEAEPALQSTDEQPLSLQDSALDEGAESPTTDQHHAQAAETADGDTDPKAEKVDETVSLMSQESSEQEPANRDLSVGSADSVDDTDVVDDKVDQVESQSQPEQDAVAAEVDEPLPQAIEQEPQDG